MAYLKPVKVYKTKPMRAPARKPNSKRTAPKKEVVAKTTKPVAAVKLEAKVWSSTGGKATSVTLPAEIFGVKWNSDLVHQVYQGMRANARPTVANTKFRGEVSGGGIKPWKQKGTGRARHGSNRSPIWRHGGITHGPRAERDFSVKINKKMRVAALMAVLSRKLKDNQIIFVDKLSFEAPKTSEARAMMVEIAKVSGISELATKRANAAVIAFTKKDLVAEKSFRNIGSVISEEVRNLNTVDLMDKRYLVIENPAEAFEILKARLQKKSG
jgi:large subunit ribosomal protein L4